MPIRKTEEELRLAELIKVARAAIRTKHSVLGDRELNQVLPDLEDAFYREIQAGVLPGEVNLKALAAEVLPDGTE